MQREMIINIDTAQTMLNLHEVIKKYEHQELKKIIIQVPAYAHLNVVYHQQESDNLECAIYAADYAQVNLRVLVTAPGVTRHNFIAQVQGVGASINGVIAYSLIGDAQYYVTTRQEHYAPHGKSSIKVRGLLQEITLSDYRSTIFITSAAPHTVALQEHKTLLMGSAARSTAIPSLEVLTHEVQCKHGSASGQLDEQQLYYLQARGISYQRARRIVLEVFFADLLGHENHDDIQRLMLSSEPS